MGFYGNTPDSGLEKVCVAAMVKAPLSELFGFVNFHLNLGVGRVMLFFDDPNDEGIAILASKPNVDCIPCDRDYWVRTAGKTDLNFDERQVVNANESIKLAKEAEDRHDSDERFGLRDMFWVPRLVSGTGRSTCGALLLVISMPAVAFLTMLLALVSNRP